MGGAQRYPSKPRVMGFAALYPSYVDMTPHSRDALRPRFAGSSPPSKTEGAGNAGCLLHPGSRVEWCGEIRTRAYRYSRGTPAFPAQWFDGLCRALPGDEFLLPPSLPARWLNRSVWVECATGRFTTTP